MSRAALSFAHRIRLVTSLACALLVAAAAAGPATAEPAANEAAGAGWAQVTREAVVDPDPPPGSVLGPGSTTIRARVRGGVGAQVSVNAVAIATTVAESADGLLIEATADLAPGVAQIEVQATTTDGAAAGRSWSVDVADLTIERVAGDNRYATAVAASQRRFPGNGSASTALLSAVGPDALAAAPPAVALAGPVLLVERDNLPDETAAELQRVVPAGSSVFVLGGVTSVGDAVVDAVEELGFEGERVAGPDRYATAGAVAALLPASGTAVVTSGERLDEALIASVPAAAHGWPLLLATAGGLPDPTREALSDLGIRDVVIVGGEAALPPEVEAVITATVPGVVTRAGSGTDGAGSLAAAVAQTLLPDGDVIAVSLAGDIVDAVAGAPLAAGLRAPLYPTTGGEAPSDVAAHGAATRHAGTAVLLGGSAAIPASAEQALRVATVDGPTAPLVTAAPEPAAVLERVDNLALTADAAVEGALLHVTAGGREVPGALTFGSGSPAVTWRAGAVPDLPPATTVAVVATGLVRTAAGLSHVRAEWTHTTPPPTSTSPEGFSVAGGISAVVGDGRLRTFTAEVDPGVGYSAQEFAAVVERMLLDSRGWTARGEWALQRVATPAEANVRVVLAFPGTVDAYCGRVGLGTGGIYSCWDGRRAMLNLNRYNSGAAPFHTDVEVYRGYLVNHEVGHGLGYGHVGCPASGQLAPVMMQQTKGVAPCVPNAWPYPHG